MPRDSLRERLESGQSALGCYVGTTEMVELAAHVGFDYFGIDQMFTGLDWSRTEDLVRAGQAYGITPVVRLQSYPWAGYDRRLATDASRAFGLGACYVFVSHSGRQEIEECAHVTHDWHQKAMTIHPFTSLQEWENAKPDPWTNQIIPQPESRTALAELDQTLEIPEVNIVMFAMTDASKQLANSRAPTWELPELWDLVDRAVAVARRKGKYVGANTSYAYTFDELKSRIVRLHEHGVRMLHVQTAALLFQLAVGPFLKDVRRTIAD